jgi:heme/copper-type cytochrome/quinol oxidase subunit 2
MRRTLLSFALGLAIAASLAGRPARAEEMTFTLVNVEYEGSKFWTPGTLVVKKGTVVNLKLLNNVPSDPNQHGFSIPAYNVAEVVTRGEPKTVKFTADKEGVFPFICQLHPAHIGGELVVLP